MAYDISGYVTVNERLKRALQQWPDLRVQETAPKLVQAGNQLFIEVTTTVWRTPDDTLPAIARCWEPSPGTSNFTRGSEQQNASTSSLGRCLGLMGVAIDAGMASKDEVALAKHRQSRDKHPANQPPDDKPQVASAALRVVDNSEPEPPPPPADWDIVEPSPGSRPATDKQMGFLRKLLKDRGVEISDMDMARLAADSKQCSRKIEELKDGV